MPSIQFSGLASGLDTDAIVDAMLQVERVPNQRREREIRILESKNEILNDLTSALSDLSSKAKALESTNDFLSYTGTSSDETTAKLAVSGLSTRGSYDLEVTQLSSSQRNYSKGYASAEEAIFDSGPDRTLTITMGGEDTTITVEAGDSLSDVAAKINSSGADVSAGLFKGSDGFRLQVAGNKTGASNAVTFGGDFETELELSANQASEAKDATALLDGFEITSDTNTFGEVMPGVTLQVFKVQEEGDAPLHLEINPDQDEVKSKVQGLIKSFNAVIDIVQQQTGKGKGPETLSGDSTVRMIESRLRQAISGVSSKLKGKDGENLSLAGIFNSDKNTGKLSLDNSKFNEILSKDFEGTARHFTGHEDPDDSSKKVAGLADRIMLMVEDLTGISKITVQASEGGEDDEGESSSSSTSVGGAREGSLIGARQKGISQRIKGNRDRIAAHERYLESYETQLRMQYSALEEMMSQLNSQGNYLSQLR